MASKPRSRMGREMFERLCEDLRALKERAKAEEGIDEAAVAGLMEQLEAATTALAREEIEQLQLLLVDAMAVVEDRMTWVADELCEIKQSRRALQGYDHIRNFDTEQRLYRRA